jgi:SMI1 / KNR4 family (SUKH-1)
VRFPADYKRFLRTINGGGPEPNWFFVPKCGGAYAHHLYGIRDKRIRGDLEYQQSNTTDPVPAGYIRIGNDPFGNRFLLTVTAADGTTSLKNGAGQVLFEDLGGFWARKHGVNTFLIAESFTEFLEGLREPPTDAEKAKLFGRNGQGD